MNLTIVVPVYNSEKTLSETISSIIPLIVKFGIKVVIVDDCSTDSSLRIITKWIENYPNNITLSKHETNKGGGAARNTGIYLANSEYILVCDSDDLCDVDSVVNLYNVASNDPSGAAHYNFSCFFRKNTKKIDNTDNFIQILNSDFFSLKSAILNTTFMVNFMFKKCNYYEAGKYPETHGWDTQGFALKYLAKYERVPIAKNSFYFHRRFFGNFSYYERELLKGNNHLNSYLIFEDISNSLPLNWLSNINSAQIFSRIYTHDFVRENVQNYKSNPNYFDKLYFEGLNLFKSNKIKDSVSIFGELFELTNSEISLFCLTRSLISIKNNNVNQSMKTFNLIKSFTVETESLRFSRLQYLKKALKIF